MPDSALTKQLQAVQKISDLRQGPDIQGLVEELKRKKNSHTLAITLPQESSTAPPMQVMRPWRAEAGLRKWSTAGRSAQRFAFAISSADT